MKKYISYLWRSGLVVVALVLFQLGANPFAQAQQTGADFDHSATGFVLNAQHQNVRCETCHVRGEFKGTPKTCEGCHGWTKPIATTVMPIKHIPTGNAPCESCHQANMSQFNDALRVFSHVSVPSQSCMACHDSRNPHPGVTVNPSDATHAKVQINNTPCGVCHTTLKFEGPKPPPNHIPFAAVACANCHTSTDYSVMPTIAAIHANAPSSSNNCAQCHSAEAAATYALPTMVPPLVGPPANHIGMSNQSCEVCHVGAGSSLQLPVVDGAKFSNSKFSHQGISTGCAACHGPNVSATSFVGMRNIILMPDSSSPGPLSHIPSSTTCETCHASSMPAGQINANATATVPGTGFQLPKPGKDAVHMGITSSCSSCHEAGMQWVGMQLYPMAGYTGFQTRPQLSAGTFNVANAFHPATGDCSQCHVGISFDPANTKKPSNHIPTSATCGSCHKDRNGDYSVMPALSDIHANSQPGMTCVQCHSTSNAAKYPMTPALMSPPGNHIPMGAAGCETCHVGPGSSMASTVVQDGDKFSGSLFSHTGISSGCDACHGASVNASSFYGVVPVALSGLVPSHMPTSAACETCHVNKIPTVLTPAVGVNFSGAKFSHAGISTGCADCHGPNIVPASFAGSPNIVVMPPNTAPGATSHIPSSTACESCHALSMPTGLVDGSAASTAVPGSKFMLPAPSISQIHTYSDVSSCNVCHEAGRTFMGMGQYPPTPGPYVAGTIYRGFQTRPNSTGGGNSIVDAAHPSTGECSVCHSGYNGFGSPSSPSGHIPVAATATCANCHGSDTVNFANAVSLANIHQYAQSTTNNCAQCHSTENSKLYPLKHASVPAITPPPDNHIPMGTAGCETCHVSSGGTSSISVLPVGNGAVFSGSKFSHTGINVACSYCHGVNVTPTTFFGFASNPIKVLDYTPGANGHMPVSSQLSCDTCHVNSVPAGLVPDGVKSFAGAQFNHVGITTDCANCHGPSISVSSFKGGGTIVVMPSTNSGPTGHIPSGTTCENCHLLAKPAGLISAVATRTVPGTGFQNSPPNSATIHGNVTVGTCDNCHGSGKEWAGMSLYPSNPLRSATRVAGTVYTGFQTRPGGAGPYAVPDSGHTTIETCSNCHTSFTGFGPPTMPGTHIPVLATASCANCHTNVDYKVMPAKSAIHKYAPSFTSNCAQCHAAGSETKYPMTPPLKVADSTHMPMGGQACETCHVDSVANLSTNDTPTFANAKFSHAGASTGCAACHVAGVGPFQGIAVTSQGSGPIVAINVPAGGATASATVHMPYTTSCETCHSNSTPSTLLAVTASTGNAAGSSGFSSPKAPVASIHIGATSCNSCHETGVSGSIGWMGLTVANRATTTAPYKGFQTRPDASATTTFRVQDAIHPTGGDCSNCHTGFSDFSSIALPQYHIPTAAVQCINCHTSGNYSPLSPPTLTAIHANAQSTTGNCVQCHSKANADNYNQLVGMGRLIVAPHSTHVAMGNLGCESCHVTSSVVSSLSLPVTTGADFRNSAYSHSGVSTGCATCHGDLTPGGTTKIFTGPSGQALTPKPAPANHVPNAGNTGCETCHTTVPSALIAFTGNPSAANSFAADKLYSHKGITTSCSTCHEGSPSFIGITNMVVLPPTSTGNHIPSSAAISASACEACHLRNTPAALVSVAPGAPKAVGTTGFLSPLPTGAEIHKGVTTGCNTCHENNMSWLGVGLYPRTANTNPKKAGASYIGFQTRPLASPGIYGQTDSAHPTTGDCSVCHGSTTSFTVSAMPANHIPISNTAKCDSCHTNISIVNGNADFSQMPARSLIHRWAPSTTVNCAQCHSDANSLKYSTSVVGMTIMSPNKLTPAHVPFGNTACEACHVIATVGDTTTFAGGKYSHTGVTTGCATCHGNGLSPTAFYGISNLIAIPTTASQGPNSHIPYGSTGCEACHLGSTPSTLSSVTGSPASVSGFRLPAPTGAMIHNGITGSCNTCHETSFRWKGMDLYPMTPAVLTAGASYKGFQTRPVSAATTYGVRDANHPTAGDCSQCHTGTTAFTALAKPAGHMPVTAPACSTCHTSDYSVAGLGLPGNLANMHTGIKTGMVTYTAATIGTKTCVTCHVAGTGGISGTAPFTGCATSTNCASPPPLNAYQPTLKEAKGAHVPIGTLDCNGCHAVVTPNFVLSNMMKNQTMHNNAKLGGVLCKDCHENGMSWFGVTGLKVRIPNKHTSASRKAPNNCDNSGCHANSTVSNGFRMLAQPIMREALVSPEMERVRPVMQPGASITRGSLGNSYDHKGVQSGQCKTCHDGKAASGMPARHLMVTTSCDTCHRPTSWTPAQFSHNGVTPNTCMACHNGMSASSKPPGHFMTARSCDSCHKTMGWKPVMYQHMSPQYHPTPDALNCISCHITNGEIIPRQMRGLTRTKPIPVGP